MIARAHHLPGARPRQRPYELSLVARLSLLAIVPATLIAVLLAFALDRNHRREVERIASATASAVAANFAAAAASAMQRGERAELSGIATTSMAGNVDLVRVQFVSREGEILAEATGPAAQAHARHVEVVHPVAATAPGTTSPGEVRLQFGLGRMDEDRRRQSQATMLLLALCLGVAGVVGWRAARRVSAPVLELAEAIDRLGRGAKGVNVELTRGGEIGRLQRGFNGASLALTAAWDEMEARVADATDELAGKNAKLEAASRARAHFLAAASHDLRQPLYALTLFSSALKAGETDPARLARASHIQECVATLDGLFSELLDLSRLESGAMQPAPSEFPLDPLLEEVSRTFRLIAEKRELRLVLRKTDVWVHADRIMLERIVNNLVSNALRYTERGGVLVGVRAAGPGRVRIEVWDTGPGIAPEHQAHVFEEFYQVASTQPEREHRERGMGLGLSIVHRLARLLGSEIVLRSRIGRGSVFSLAIAQVPAGTRLRPAPAEAPLDMSGLRVLVIDDEPSILEGMRVLMHSWNCEMRAAEDAEQAVAAVRDWGPPEIVLSDLKLGGGRSGLDALRRLDAHYGVDAGARRPFARLLITGETKGERLQEAAAAQIPVLHKPVPPERLREAMMAAVLAHQG